MRTATLAAAIAFSIAAATAALQNYSADPTNTFPITRPAFLRGPAPSGFDALRDSSLLVYLPLAATSAQANAATTWADYSGHKNDGTWKGTAFAGNYRGKISAIGPYFNKSNSNMALTPPIAMQPTFTLSAWVSLNSPSPSQYMRIIEGDYTKTFFLGSTNTGYWGLIVANSSATACKSPTAATTGQWSATGASSWTMVSGTYDGTNEKLYVNGQLVNTCAQAPTNFVTTPLPVGIGGCAVASYCGNGAGYLDGQAQGIRIYSRALAGAEIAAIYNAENLSTK